MKARWLRLGAMGMLPAITLALAATLSADSGPAHQVLQPRPIKLGTSGGNIRDITRLACCTGTLGALVQKDSVQYILSNNHVLARTNFGTEGEQIIQPGLVDQTPACFRDPGDVVAVLSDFEPILFTFGSTNVIDAAIAQVLPGTVVSSGEILDVGTISNTPATATLGMAVQKSARTTGLTTGTVTAIDVSIFVAFPPRCRPGPGTAFALFTDQIRISPGTFSAPGDSGSLVVEDKSPNPMAIGLVFAGSSTDTFANPVQSVLDRFGVTLVGAANGSQAPFWNWLGWFLPAVRSAHAAQAPLRPTDPRSLAAARLAKERNERGLMRLKGVVGTGVGISDADPREAVVEVYVERLTPALRGAIAPRLDSAPVKIVATGPIMALVDACPAR